VVVVLVLVPRGAASHGSSVAAEAIVANELHVVELLPNWGGLHQIAAAIPVVL
jgi:hypothetical protein